MKGLIFSVLLLSALAFTPAQAQVMDWLKDKAKETIKQHLGKSDAETAPGVEPTITERGKNHVILDYGFFLVNYSCEHRGFNYVSYNSVPDQGHHSRYEPFHQEPALRQVDCASQLSTDSYKKRPGQKQYHRGHGFPQNHIDHNPEMMAVTNRMTNVVPQNGKQNASGLWRTLETRVECARDETTVTVYLGNDWGNDTSNDHFKRSHGVTTPDSLWRVHVYESHPNQAYVWYIPNTEVPDAETETAYRITLDQLYQATRDDFDWPFSADLMTAQTQDPYMNTRCSWR